MSTSFPTTLDQYATVPENQAVPVQHRDRHQNIEDAMEAVQAKVGVNNSAVTTSFDYRIRALENSAVIGNNWTYNAVPVGLPDGSLGEVLLTANTFLGRSSAGDATAKQCTDFGFTLLQQINAGAVLTTIGAQPSDATLSALSAYNTNGLLTQTAPDTFAGRTLTGTAGRVTVTNGDGVAGNPTLNIPTTLIDSGTYTPTVTGITNVSAATANVSQWLRVGNVVTLSGFANITPTGAGSTEFEISLPVASDFTQTFQAGGGGSNSEATLTPCHIIADVANNRVQVTFNSTTANLRAVIYHATYLVL